MDFTGLSAVALLATTHPPTVYEPCHALCTLAAGRVQAAAADPTHAFDRVQLRLRLDGVSLVGAWTERFVPIADGASASVLDLLPSVAVSPAPWVRVDFGMPWELNHSDGVLIPSLHETELEHTGLEPGGPFLSVAARRVIGPVSTWWGLGYRLSTPNGTVDVSDVVGDSPEFALDALGAGTDDLYLIGSAGRSLGDGAWTLAAGLELRLHMLLRFEDVHGATTGWQAAVGRRLDERVDLGLAAHGFATAIFPAHLGQRSLLTVGPTVRFRATESVELESGASSEVPVRGLQRNALQTVTVSTALVASF